MYDTNSLNSVYFVKIPENAQFSSAAFKIDPAIELPVQKKNVDDEIETDFAKLSQEQILSGILTVLTYDKQNVNADYYRKLIVDVRPDIKKELSEAAYLKTHNEEWDLAEEIWNAVHGVDPEDLHIILNMALFYDLRADSLRTASLNDEADAYDELALKYYKITLDTENEIPDSYFNLGFYYLKKRNYADAKGCFESFLALTADFTDEELGDDGMYRKERAQEIINNISNRNLEDDRIRDSYDFICNGQEEKGIEEIRKFIRDNPVVWNGWFLLGWGLRLLERFSDARQAFEKALECEGGQNLDVINELSICLSETGDVEQAKKILMDALSLDAEDVRTLSNLACVCLKLGDKESAKKFFNVVLEICPEDKIAKAQLENLE